MGCTSSKIEIAIARLNKRFVFWDKKEEDDKVELPLDDVRELGRILGSYELVRVLGRSERFGKPVTVSVMIPGYFRREDYIWRQKLVGKVPSVGQHEVHYVNESGYWTVMADVAQKLEFAEGI